MLRKVFGALVLASGAVLLTFLAPRSALGDPLPPPARGDVDRDGNLIITDAVNVLGFLFLGTAAPYCEVVADADANGEVLITDPIYVLAHLFLGGPALPPLSEEEEDSCTNDPPAIPPHSVYRTYPGFLVELPIGATDGDGDPLSYRSESLPPDCTLDEASGVVRWVPAADQLGPFYIDFTVSDDGDPPLTAEGRLVFQVLPPDACTEIECDPAAGCVGTLLPITQDCCDGKSTERVVEPEVGCPEGRVLHVGRNALGFGRLQNCDRVRAVFLGQGGVGVTLNFAARCVNGAAPVTLAVSLTTRQVVLFNFVRAIQPRPDGIAEFRRLTFPIEPAESAFATEGAEAELRARLTDVNGVTVERNLRVVITRGSLGDLPDLP
jgi:hypothetical protein